LVFGDTLYVQHLCPTLGVGQLRGLGIGYFHRDVDGNPRGESGALTTLLQLLLLIDLSDCDEFRNQ